MKTCANLPLLHSKHLPACNLVMIYKWADCDGESHDDDDDGDGGVTGGRSFATKLHSRSYRNVAIKMLAIKI